MLGRSYAYGHGISRHTQSLLRTVPCASKWRLFTTSTSKFEKPYYVTTPIFYVNAGQFWAPWALDLHFH